MLYRIYEKYLEKQISASRQKIPDHITLVLTEYDLPDKKGTQNLRAFLEWAISYRVSLITIYVDVIKMDHIHTSAAKVAIVAEDVFNSIGNIVDYEIVDPDGAFITKSKGDGIRVQMFIGFGGRREITHAVTSILDSVQKGELSPEDIDEHTIESNLMVKEESDIVIRAG